jgi:type IV pilus assembly protein PilB
VADAIRVQRAEALAEEHGLPFVDLDGLSIDASLLTIIPRSLLLRAPALPIRAHGPDAELVEVAIADPTDFVTLDELRLTSRRPLHFVVATRDDIEAALEHFAEDQASAIEVGPTGGGAEATPPAVREVTEILARAASLGASDVHLIPDGEKMRVRVRVDGVVHDLNTLDPELIPSVVARIKVLAQLNIADHRRAQDGRLSLRSGGHVYDVRVAVLPSVNGESVILRLLEKSRSAPTLTEIGLENDMQMQLERVINRRTGALLVTGPTGSGKSTTVYAALADLAQPGIHVITIEDPVEYRIPGLLQIQVDESADTTFSSALRASLRGDPDVIMVGEMRDDETAQLTMTAALTGHFVLSTLHSNDAPGALTRIVEMGVEPYLTAAGISAVLAQRLARRLCAHCRVTHEPSPAELEQLGLREGSLLYRPGGCAKCHRGYRGRIGLFQLLQVTPEVRSAVLQRSTPDDLQRAAEAAGMKTIWADGLAKATAGLTSVDELRRVLAV